MSQVKRILVPTDFSATSDLATEYAIDMAFRYGAVIHLVHAVDDTNYLAVYPDGYVDRPDLRKSLEDDARNGLAALAKKCETARVGVTSDVLTGKVAPAIVEAAAARDVDLIVMGTHGRSGFAQLFLGSVAERVVRSAPCPVLTVRENARVQTILAADAAARREPLPVGSRGERRQHTRTRPSDVCSGNRRSHAETTLASRAVAHGGDGIRVLARHRDLLAGTVAATERAG